jgi:hypothetical protein
MASEISVERQFRFHCPCGATIVTGERTVTCTACGITLGVRRVRRHRQHRRDSIAYYGSTSTHTLPRPASSAIPTTPSSPGWTLPVHRVEKRTQIQNTETISGIKSRLGAWFKRVLAHCGKALNVMRIKKHMEVQRVLFDIGPPSAGSLASCIPDEPPALPVINTSPRIHLREGVRVKVRPTRPDGKPHPHSGKTGKITRFIDCYSCPDWNGPLSAAVKLDAGILPQGFIWVSLECLEALPEIQGE